MTTQTMQMQTVDPWDSVDNPQFRVPEYWGNVKIDTFFAALVKGVGKVPFNPSNHSADQRVTAIEINIAPIAEQNVQFPVSRSLIAESKTWAGMVLPSIKALGLSVRELNGKWVHVTAKPTGRTYTNSNGEIKEETTFEFTAVFPDEKACKDDYAARGHSTPSALTPTSAAPAPAATTTTSTTGNGSKEQETASKFLKVIVENACKGQQNLEVIRNTVAANLATMPLVNKFFSVDSPETMQMIMEKMQDWKNLV
jgi:hypothetical protein